MSADFDTLTLTTDARGVATLTLNRPEVHNAFGEEMIADLRKAAAQLATDDAVRLVVITGAGKSFSAGGDIRWFKKQVDASRDERIAGSGSISAMYRALEELPKPVIGKINGQAYGGGNGLIAVCDIAIGATTAKFGLTEVRLGLLPSNVSTFIVRRMGQRNARRVMLSGRIFTAAEAVELGLLDAAVPLEELDAAVEAEIAEFLEAAPGASAKTKELIRFVDRHGIEDCMAFSARSLADAWEAEEGQEGIAAFLEKRKAAWKPE